MNGIYQPKGKAREYSPLALNIYNGCDHGCTYCYVPSTLKKTKQQHKVVIERKDLLDKLRSDCLKIKEKQQVLLCFSGDPYCRFNEASQMTERVLRILLNNHFPVAVLSKGGKRILKDLEIFKMFGQNIKIGQTLTFIDPEKSLQFEPYASLPEERIEVFTILKENNIKTWASIEPVIMPDESLEIIKRTIGCCDEYQVGKLNHFPQRERNIKWPLFLKSVIDILRDHNKKIYIKKDLAAAAPTIKLSEQETRMDALALKREVEASEQKSLF